MLRPPALVSCGVHRVPGWTFSSAEVPQIVYPSMCCRSRRASIQLLGQVASKCQSCIGCISVWDLCYALQRIRLLANSGMLRTFESDYNCEGALQKGRGRCSNGLRKGISQCRILARPTSPLGGVTSCIPQLAIAALAFAFVNISPIKPRCSCCGSFSVNMTGSLRGDCHVIVII